MAGAAVDGALSASRIRARPRPTVSDGRGGSGQLPQPFRGHQVDRVLLQGGADAAGHHAVEAGRRWAADDITANAVGPAAMAGAVISWA